VLVHETDEQSQANQDIVLRWFDEVWMRGNVEAYDRFAHLNCTLYLAGYREPLRGLAAVKQWAREYRAGFPDVHFTIDEVLARGSTVVLRWHSEQTHTSEYMGMPATGRVARTVALQMLHLDDGKFGEVWLMFDALGVLQQLGILPSKPLPRVVIRVMTAIRRLRGILPCASVARPGWSRQT